MLLLMMMHLMQQVKKMGQWSEVHMVAKMREPVLKCKRAHAAVTHCCCGGREACDIDIPQSNNATTSKPPAWVQDAPHFAKNCVPCSSSQKDQKCTPQLMMLKQQEGALLSLPPSFTAPMEAHICHCIDNIHKFVLSCVKKDCNPGELNKTHCATQFMQQWHATVSVFQAVQQLCLLSHLRSSKMLNNSHCVPGVSATEKHQFDASATRSAHKRETRWLGVWRTNPH